MYLALVCTEDVAFIRPKEVKQHVANTFIGSYWYDQLARACQPVPRGTIPATFRLPVQSVVPALLLSGYLDPTTPPEWGAQVARHVPNSLHVEMRYRSHSFSPADQPCAQDVMSDFIRSASVRNLDVTCLEAIRRPPFARR